jgi:uncharacterized protein DUF932
MYKRVENTGDQGVHDLFSEAGLLYEVESKPTFYLDDDGVYKPVRTKRNHVLKVKGTDATHFDDVSSDWKLYQPMELADWAAETCEKFKLKPFAAGAYEGSKVHGQIGWFQARLPGNYEPFKGDFYAPLLTITEQQKYGTTIGAGFTSLRIFCKNSFHAADATLQVRFTHREAFDIEKAAEKIAEIAKQWTNHEEALQYIGSKKMTTASDIVEYFQTLFPPSAEAKEEGKLSKATALILSDDQGAALETQPGVEVKRGSWYQAFNAVTYTIDHLLDRQSEKPGKRELAAQYGPRRATKQRALALAIEFAKKSADLEIAA